MFTFSSFAAPWIAVILLSTIFPAAAQTDSDNPELARARAWYSSAMQPIAAEREAKVDSVKRGYVAELDNLQRQVTSRGDLTSALAIKAERERVVAKAPPSSEESEAVPSMLVGYRNKYEKDIAAVQSEIGMKEETVRRQYSVALETLQRSITARGDLDKAKAVKEERDQIVAAQGIKGAPLVPGSQAFMTNTTVKRLFKLSNAWKIEGGVLAADLNETPDKVEYLLPNPVFSVRFGLKMQSKWYQGIEIVVDERPYLYSFGFWSNTGSGVWTGNDEALKVEGKKAIVTSPGEWTALSASLMNDQVQFMRGQEVIWTGPAPKQQAHAHRVSLSFRSYKTHVSVKDVFVETK